MRTHTYGIEATQRRLRGRWSAFAALLIAALLVVTSGVASAQDPQQTAQVPPRIVQIDARQGLNAKVFVRSSGEVTNGNVSAQVNNERVEVTSVKRATEEGARINTVVVIDNSEEAGTFAYKELQTAAVSFLKSVTASEGVAVVSMGGTAQIRFNLSRSAEQAASAMSALQTNGATELWSSIVVASKMLAEDGTGVNNIIVLSASQDSGRAATADTAVVEALQARAAVNVVALRSDRVQGGQIEALANLAQRTGGLMQTASQAGLVPPLVVSAGNAVRSVYSVGLLGDQIQEGGNLKLTVNGAELEAGFIKGSVTRGANLTPFRPNDPVLPFLSTGLGKTLAILLLFAAILLGAYAIGTSVVRTEEGLHSVLMPYTGDDAEQSSQSSYGAIFQRAVDITSGIAERRGLLSKAEDKLEQAALPLRAAEAVTGYAGIVIVAFIGSFVLTRSLIWMLMWTAIGVLFPIAFVNFKISRRKKKFMSQLPDTLSLLAGTLKAGYSFMQGVEAVSQEVEEPMGAELRRVVTEAQLGRPVEEALESSAARMDSEDFAWAVMAVRIQREVGGNLAELLMTVAETMIARSRIKGEIKALTAEGRMSAIILGFLPPALGVVMYVINPEYMQVLFQETMGLVMIGSSVVMMIIGFLWMLKIINIKV